jgi:hypothetical protein
MEKTQNKNQKAGKIMLEKKTFFLNLPLLKRQKRQQNFMFQRGSERARHFWTMIFVIPKKKLLFGNCI